MNGAKRMMKGFTLLEMMLVVVIIGLLASVAVWNFAGRGDTARKGATVGSLNIIKGALTAYYTEKGSYPPSLVALVPQYLDKSSKDGWREDFVYYTPSQDPSRPYTLVSKGPDRIIGTADDISVWAMDEGN